MPAFARLRAFAAALALATIAPPLRAAAQESNAAGPPMADHPMPDMMHHHHMMTMHGPQTSPVKATQPGQGAFGAIQEIVGILEADSKTDWFKVNLEALRQHLIDMNEVTLKADAVAKPVDGGLAVAVTGNSRTVEAIQRMVPAHARVIDQMHLNGWNAKTGMLPDGVLLTVTSSNPKEVPHIRGLGFIGLMVSGHHHQPHPFAMAKGKMVH